MDIESKEDAKNYGNDYGIQKFKQETPLEPGTVVLATNIGGRGTDFKLSDQVLRNGGMQYVFVCFMINF